MDSRNRPRMLIMVAEPTLLKAAVHTDPSLRTADVLPIPALCPLVLLVGTGGFTVGEAMYSCRDTVTSMRGCIMKTRPFVVLGLILFFTPPMCAQSTVTKKAITCRAMEVFVSEPLGVSVVVFHQSDKADGPRLGELLLAHAGEQVEFETPDGKKHAATVERVKSCFGRGLIMFSTKGTKLVANQDFVVYFSVPQ